MALQTKSLTTSFDIIRFFLQKWTKISENALLVVKYGLRGFKLLAEVIRGVQFKDGERIDHLKEGELNRVVV